MRTKISNRDRQPTNRSGTASTRLIGVSGVLLTICALGFVFGATRPEQKGLKDMDVETGGEKLNARQVIEAQLVSLKNNDQPFPDAGIDAAWAFAHPSNQRATGPLERFTRMLKSPTYRALINHSAHEVELVTATEARATFDVLVFPGGNVAPIRYRWTVALVESGERAGEWATTAVSAPKNAGLPPA